MLKADVQVDDKDLNLKPDEGKDDQEDKKSWKADQKVPYERFEKVVRDNQELKKTFNERLDKLETLLKGNASRPSDKDLTDLDRRVSGAKHWDEVIDGIIPEVVLKKALEDPKFSQALYDKIEGMRKGVEGKAQEEVDKEISDLRDREIITTKEEENKLIDYAIKESQETGRYIPLIVAQRMMVKEGKWGNKTEDRTEANRKIRPAKDSGKESDQEKGNYKRFKKQSLDEMIAEEAAKLDKNSFTG